MSDADREKGVRRILVAIDASPPSLSALEVAAELAATLDAELLGLYVEDINLLRLAELPLAGEVTIYTSTPRRFSRPEIEHELRTQARMARRALAHVAELSQLRWSFHVEQGVIEARLLSAAQQSDIILLGKGGWTKRRRLGTTARIVVERAPRPIMVVQEGSRIGQPVGLIYDGSQAAQRALWAAADLLRKRGDFLTVVIVAANSEQARDLQSDVSGWVRERNIHVHFRWLTRANVNGLLHIAHGERCGTWVVPAGGEAFDRGQLIEFLNRMECPVLLVR